MADPFSLTANAVGVISLGITICQGLISYCQAFAGQYGDVRLAVQDLRGLENSLTFLRGTLTLMALHRPDLFNLVTPYIDKLKSRIDNLQPILSKLGKNVSGQGSFKDKVKLATQRTLYPFKKGMIHELRNTVRQAQDNLTLALGVVQVDLLADIASFEGDISTLVQQNAIAQTSLSAVRQDMRQIESGLIGRLDSVLLQLQKMAQESREISCRTATAVIPATWDISGDSFTEELPDHEKSIGTADSADGQKSLTKSRRCTCVNILHRQTKSLWTNALSLSWSDSAMSRHLKTCQYWNPYQEEWTTKLSVFHVNLLVCKALSASIRISKQAGYFSISPSLTLRGVVNESSPAFTLLKDLVKLYDFHRIDSHSDLILQEQTSLVTRNILRLLKEGAVSPHEVDKEGRTLLHNALSCPYDPYRLDEVPAFRELIQTLLDAGVSINEVDLAGMTAFDFLTSHATVFYFAGSPAKSVGILLANNGAEMSDVRFIRPDRDFLDISQELQNFATLEPWQDAAQCGPLSQAILRQSEYDVIRILRAKPSSVQELNRRKQSPLHLACRWSRGIKLLLDVGASHLIHQVDAYGWLPIAYSIWFQCFDAIQLFLDAGSALSSPGWTEPWEQVLSFRSPIPSFIISILRDRRRKLFEFAKATLPSEVWADLEVPTDRLLDERAAEIQSVLVDMGIEIPRSITVPQMRGTVYHSDIAFTAADQLWDAGFKDIDTWDGRGLTPLMAIQPVHLMDLDLEYIQWLLNHGADPYREARYSHNDNDGEREPVTGSTALHFVVYRFGSYLLALVLDRTPHNPPMTNKFSLLQTFQGLLVTALRGGSHDDCHCACSPNGCTPFKILLKAISDQHELHYSLETSKKPSELRRLIVQQLELPGHPASSAPMRSKIAKEVIRYETFESLQLSHTCCRFSWWTRPISWFTRRYTSEEVREIHEEEEELLQKHEDLVSEFCHKFQELGGTLTSFLKGYWQTRMEEVLKEGKPLNEEAMRRLREMGIVLKEVSEEAEDFTNEEFTDEDYDEEEYNDEVHDQEIQAEDGDSGVGSEGEYALARSKSSEQEAGDDMLNFTGD